MKSRLGFKVQMSQEIRKCCFYIFKRVNNEVIRGFKVEMSQK